MTNDKGILIRNIYYMLSYAFHVLHRDDYARVAAEDFDGAQALFAAILAHGVSQQLKQGLYREYVPLQDNLRVLRGRIDISGTIRNKLNRSQRLTCEFDELSENNIYNQILKTTMTILAYDAQNVRAEYRKKLKQLLRFFNSVEWIEPSTIPWGRLSIQRNNRNYEMLLNICYFVLDGLVQTTEDGRHKMIGFSDEQMSRLYEKFVLEYYRHHYAPNIRAQSTLIDWALPEEVPKTASRFLPAMKTDITLRHNGKTLIIDTKYYAKTMQRQFDRETFHSHNLYQIFAYVKNEDKMSTGDVSGMLLYAKTEESITPDAQFTICGNRFGVKTLDLNRTFEGIAEQLDFIVSSYFGTVPKKQ